MDTRNAVPPFKSVKKILWCDHSSENLFGYTIKQHYIFVDFFQKGISNGFGF